MDSSASSAVQSLSVSRLVDPLVWCRVVITIFFKLKKLRYLLVAVFIKPDLGLWKTRDRCCAGITLCRYTGLYDKVTRL